MENIVKYFLSALLLIFVQVGALNNIQLFNLVTPLLYVYFLIKLPLKTNQYLFLTIALILGYAIDMFSNSYGVNMISCVSVAFLRPYIIELFVTKETLGKMTPSIKSFGIPFYRYAAIMVLIHHLITFLLEAFSPSLIVNVLAKTLLSSAVTIILISTIENINFTKRRH